MRPTEVDPDDRSEPIVPSDPLVGDLPAGGRARIRGSSWICGLGVVPSSSIAVRDGAKGGGDEETRTPDPLLAKETLCQLSYVPEPVAWMVGVSGLEPETSALSGQCSNQLS